MQSLSEALLERLKQRQAVLVAGLGCSELAGAPVLPGWHALALALAEKVADPEEKQALVDLVERGHLSAALATLRATLPEATLVETLQGLLPARAQAPEAIRALAEAPWRGIVSTGLDTLWTAALGSAPDLAGRMVFAANAAGLGGGRGRFLIQLFGRPDVPASLCLCPSDLRTVLGSTGADKFLEGLHRKWSFVFAGFTPNDPDLALLAGRVLGNSGSTLEHFFVAPGLSAMDVRRVKAEFGLTGLAVEGSLEDVAKALAAGCALASDKPPADDVEAWLERWTADHQDEEAQDMVDQGLAMLRENREWEHLVAGLVSRAEIEPEVADQAADLYEAAMVLDKELAAPERGYPVIMMALHLTPHDASLLNDAKQMADKAGQSPAYLEELRHIEREATDSADLRAMRFGMARMLADDPLRQDEAIAAYQKLVDRDVHDNEAMSHLESLLRKADHWEALGELYQKILASDPDNLAVQGKLEEVYQRTQKIPQLIDLLQARLARTPAERETWRRLESLYEENQRWQPLTSMYERHLEQHADDREVRAKLEAIYHKTQQWQPLGALYARDLESHPDSTDALNKIEDLYRKSDQWRALADLLEKRAERREPAGARSMRLERAGLLIDKLEDYEAALAVARGFGPADPSAAEEIYAKVLDRDPGNADALLALSDLARDKGDYLRAAKFILDAAERTQNPLELGRLFTEAGTLYLEHGDDPAKAIALLERALAADPEQTTAAGRLLAVREKAEDWAGAEPLLDLLVRKAMEASGTSDDGSGGKADLFVRQAANAQKLGKLDKAATAFEVAAKLDRNSATLALKYADILFERQAWPEAHLEYQRGRDLLADKAQVGQKAELCERLGACALALKDGNAAIAYYEEALALEPSKRAILETLIDLQAAREAWNEHVELKRRLLALSTSDEEKARLLDEVGDVLRDKLGDVLSAMDAYRDALTLQPQRRATLYKTLDFHTQEKEWTAALATLETLAGLESDPAARARLRYAMAAIQRDEMKDTGKAVELFAKVLQDDPLYPKACEAIEKLLGETKDWKGLEQIYRAQLARLPEHAPAETRLRLWDALAEMAGKLHDKDGAAAAQEAAVALDHDNLARQERLANLYFSMGPAAADKAIAQHQALIARKPDRIDSYKALAALFFQTGAQDKMWCVAGAMTCLGRADPPLRALYENVRPPQMTGVPAKLTDELWGKVVHPDENPHLGALLALLSPALAAVSAQPHKALGLERQARLDIASNQWSYAGALRQVAGALGMALPDVFIKRDVAGTIVPVNLKEKNSAAPALLVGSGFDQLSTQSQVVFDLAKRMVELRPERLVRISMATPAGLESAVRAGLQLGGMSIGPGSNPDEVDRLVKQIEGQLSTPLRVELKLAAKRYVEACGDTIDIARWIATSDLTASRAALALCGDIAAAARVLALEPMGHSPLSIADRIYDLLKYVVGQDHFTVRAALGLQVVLPAPAAASQPTRRPSHAAIKSEL